LHFIASLKWHRMATRPENWDAVKRLFEDALEQESGQRILFLRKNCADPNIRAEVERLLTEHEQAGTFLSSPAIDGLPLEGKSFVHHQKLATGGLLAGRFRIVRFIAAGGMGEVYEAEDLELHDRVAIKVIRPELLSVPNSVERFKREVHLA